MDDSARVPLAPLAYPSIEDVVQEHIGEDWADPRSLRAPRFDRHPFTALQNTGLQPSLDQTNDPSVSNSVLQHPHKPLVVQRVEKCSDVKIEHPAHPLRHQRPHQALECPVWAAAWSESVAEPVEVGLINGIQNFGHRALDDLVLQDR
jgi:hypothetical protein